MKDKPDIKVVGKGHRGAPLEPPGPPPPTPGSQAAEKARLAALPRATIIPSTDPDTTKDIKFEFAGELHVVEIRTSTYARQKQLIHGLKGEEYEDDEGRTHRVRDLYAEADLIDRIFEDWVLTINGRSWNYNAPAMATLGDDSGKWLAAFMEAFSEEAGLEEVLGEARKKSGAP